MKPTTAYSFGKALLVSATLALTACSPSSHVLTGKPRPPITPDQVTIYSQAPARYEEIARLSSSSRGSFSYGAQAKSDKVIERMKLEAAKLGANGVILFGINDRQSGSIGTGFGSGSASGNSAVGVGFGTSVATYQKEGVGLAIFVPPN